MRVAASMGRRGGGAAYYMRLPPPAAQAAAEPSLHLRKEASACMVVEQLSPRAPPLT